MSFIPLSKADVDILEKEQREIERRRREEAERKQRIFDDKKRSMGVDAAFIQTQIDEKAQARKDKVTEGRADRAKVESFVEKLTVLNDERNAFFKERTHGVGAHQKNSSVRDCDTFDLNDPEMVKKDAPPRTTDDQTVPSCALQKFDGEDLAMGARVAKQQKEVREWCAQIIREKQTHRESDAAAVAEYVAQRNAHLEHLDGVDSSTRQQRKASSMACSAANLAQSAEREHREASARQSEAAQCSAEVAQMMASEFLNETWASTTRADDATRFIPYNFKGLSQAQRQAILDAQATQQKDNAQRTEQAKDEDEAHFAEQQRFARKALLQMRQAQRLKQQRSAELFATHENQIEETKRKTQAQNDVYANKVTPAYFEQFGTSTR